MILIAYVLLRLRTLFYLKKLGKRLVIVRFCVIWKETVKVMRSGKMILINSIIHALYITKLVIPQKMAIKTALLKLKENFHKSLENTNINQ